MPGMQVVSTRSNPRSNLPFDLRQNSTTLVSSVVELKAMVILHNVHNYVIWKLQLTYVHYQFMKNISPITNFTSGFIPQILSR